MRRRHRPKVRLEPESDMEGARGTVGVTHVLVSTPSTRVHQQSLAPNGKRLAKLAREGRAGGWRKPLEFEMISYPEFQPPRNRERGIEVERTAVPRGRSGFEGKVHAPGRAQAQVHLLLYIVCVLLKSN